MTSSPSNMILLGDEEENELKKTFIEFDENRNGMLDPEEMTALFEYLNIPCASHDVQVVILLVTLAASSPFIFWWLYGSFVTFG